MTHLVLQCRLNLNSGWIVLLLSLVYEDLQKDEIKERIRSEARKKLVLMESLTLLQEIST
jgi:hypothetical protein